MDPSEKEARGRSSQGDARRAAPIAEPWDPYFPALAVSPPLITLAIWLVFEKVLYLSLPPGLLVDVL